MKHGKFGCCLKQRMRNCFGGKRCSETVTPLSQRGRAGRIKVCKVTGDRRVCARMASLGVYPGVEADIICAEHGSQCILKVHGGTISLDNEISNNILVTSL